MGAVWKSADATLDRDVAIKVLPADFASDAEGLASLNHPNLGTIYGFHEANGIRFLAMELIPGEDLAERLNKGSVPVSEAVVGDAAASRPTSTAKSWLDFKRRARRRAFGKCPVGHSGSS